jgi:hypothetical protein
MAAGLIPIFVEALGLVEGSTPAYASPSPLAFIAAYGTYVAVPIATIVRFMPETHPFMPTGEANGVAVPRSGKRKST